MLKSKPKQVVVGAKSAHSALDSSKPATFAERLRHLREKSGLHSYDIADKMGVRLSIYLALEAGKKEPTFVARASWPTRWASAWTSSAALAGDTMYRIIGDITCTDGILRTVYQHEDGGQYVVDDGELVLGHWLELPEEPAPPEPCDRPTIVYEGDKCRRT